MKEIKESYLVMYDLPPEREAVLKELRIKKKQGKAFTQAEADAWKINKTKQSLRFGVLFDVREIGVKVNHSCYAVPTMYKKQAEKIIERYRGRYKELLNVDPEKLILDLYKFSDKRSISVSQKRALQSLKSKLNRLMDKIDDLDDKVEKEKREVRDHERKTVSKEMDIISDLAGKFQVDDELETLIVICDEKIKNVGE